ncbi:MAG: shikimate kinase [Clostridium sp.]|uniref:shikimate kinase n=1 Tax=Clostridium sp. TaxID=1506 RepID=UPI0025C1232C|nr:shikimate kinase [Clostridium sp.]MCH3963072.1 shikimate kinase [Clostridium sp.]MCI1716465.1 shikimate kinase [Clostridium sp.]MCI1800805.1 shikimate kinase [Clostridium sp.]MCI1814540.1 shikimate kinase [Clostridium sp.]MCI1871450.1 shikimate kinase [Clostridium sp.]
MENTGKNIVLIGMPGSGKTLIGSKISLKLNKKFVDLDEYIENKEGCPVTEIFEKGENYFRLLESRAAEEVSAEDNIIISTGGGIIKNFVNIINLKKKGVIIFIDRPIQNIIGDVNIESRPLLKDGVDALKKIYRERYDIYKKYCDFKVNNTGSIDETVDAIIMIFNRAGDINE